MLREHLQDDSTELRIPIDLVEKLSLASQEWLERILEQLTAVTEAAEVVARERAIRAGVDEQELAELERAHEEAGPTHQIIDLEDDDGLTIGRICAACDFEILFEKPS